MSYLSVTVSLILVNFHSVREAAEENLEHGWEQNRDLQILSPTHRNLSEETERNRDIDFLHTTLQLCFSSFILLNSAWKA